MRSVAPLEHPRPGQSVLGLGDAAAALLVDYVLTISISIAAGVDALFSLLPPEAQPVKPTDDKRESNGKLLYSNGKPLLKPGQMTVGEYAKTPEGKEWGKLISSTFDNIFHHYQSFIDTFEHLVEMK